MRFAVAIIAFELSTPRMCRDCGQNRIAAGDTQFPPFAIASASVPQSRICCALVIISRMCLTRRALIVTITSPIAQIYASNETERGCWLMAYGWWLMMMSSGYCPLDSETSQHRVSQSQPQRPTFAFYVQLSRWWFNGDVLNVSLFLTIFVCLCVAFSTFCNLWPLPWAIADGLR